MIFEDHDTSTEIYLKQIGVEEKFGYNSLLYGLFRTFFRYDAFFFLRHAYSGYTIEKNYAFFPFYPLILRNLTKFIVGEEGMSELALLSCSLVFNFIMGIISVITFYKLSEEVLQDE